MSDVAQAFAEHVQRRDLGRDVQVLYRVTGGMPSQRIEFEVALDAVSGATIVASDARARGKPQRAAISAESLDVVGLMQDLSAGLHSLTPASQAKILPDALSGSITLAVGRKKVTFHFIPEEEKRTALGKAVDPSMERALNRLWRVSKSAAGQKEEPGRE